MIDITNDYFLFIVRCGHSKFYFLHGYDNDWLIDGKISFMLSHTFSTFSLSNFYKIFFETKMYR